MIPPELVPAFDALNAGRISIGCKPFQWEDRLAAIAQELADYAHIQYAAGILYYYRDGHWQWLERAKRHQWIDSLAIRPPGVGQGTGNRSEYGLDGQSDGDSPKDRDGWRHPPIPALDHAKNVVETLTTGRLPKGEGHVVDFRAAWTHAGIGYKAGFFIIEYGFIIPEPDTPFKFY